MTNQSASCIDGIKLAKLLCARQQPSIQALKKKKITPHLAVIFSGTNEDMLVRIAHKEKVGKQFGVKVTRHQFSTSVSYQNIAQDILKLSTDPTIHGIIIERPLPSGLSAEALTKRVALSKDVDGFLEKSPYLPPLGAAIGAILSSIYFEKMNSASPPPEHFSRKLLDFLKHRKLVLIGRGETGGQPIANTLRKYRMRFFMIHSETQGETEFIKNADIIISAVGKAHFIKSTDLKSGVILLGVGSCKKGTAHEGDYLESDIKNVAAYYTPVTGGIDVVNTACLMENVITACKMQTT